MDQQIKCMKCKVHTDNVDKIPVTTKNGKYMLNCKCSECNGKKSRFIKYDDYIKEMEQQEMEQQEGGLILQHGMIKTGMKNKLFE